MLTVEQAEEFIDNRAFLRSSVKAGDKVRFGAWVITITQAGIDCDCGKGVYCPLNPQVRTLP